MSSRSLTRPKKWALVFFNADRKFCIVECRKIKVDRPFEGQKNVEVLLSNGNKGTIYKADVIDVNDSYEALQIIQEEKISEKCTPSKTKRKIDSSNEDLEIQHKEKKIARKETKTLNKAFQSSEKTNVKEIEICNSTKIDEKEKEAEKVEIVKETKPAEKKVAIKDDKVESKDIVKKIDFGVCSKDLLLTDMLPGPEYEELSVESMINEFTDTVNSEKVDFAIGCNCDCKENIKQLLEAEIAPLRSKLDQLIQLFADRKDRYVISKGIVVDKPGVMVPSIVKEAVKRISIYDESSFSTSSAVKEKQLPTTVLGSAIASSFDILTESNTPPTPHILTESNIPPTPHIVTESSIPPTPYKLGIKVTALPNYSPSSTTLVQCVSSSVSSRKGGLGTFIGELLDAYFSRDEQRNLRVNAVNKVYSKKIVQHGQLDPVRMAKIKEKARNVYRVEYDKMTESEFNEIVNRRGRALYSRFLKKIAK